MRHFGATLAIAAIVALLSCSAEESGPRASGSDQASGATGETISPVGESQSPLPASGAVDAGSVDAQPPGDVGGLESAAAEGHLTERGTADSTSGVASWPTWPESASAEVSQYISLRCSTLVYSTTEELWDRITTVRSFVLWYAPWKGEPDLTRSLTAVGDTLTYSGAGGVGRSVVTWYEPMSELRIVHEMRDGSCGGSLRLRVRQTTGGVGLIVEEVMPSSGLDVRQAGGQLCKRTVLIKRLAEGE